MEFERISNTTAFETVIDKTTPEIFGNISNCEISDIEELMSELHIKAAPYDEY